MSILSVKLDILHTLDLGVAAYLHGSLLFSIMEELPATSRPLAAKIVLLTTNLANGLDSPPHICSLRTREIEASQQKDCGDP